MNRLIPLIRKEFQHIFRDKKTLLIMFVMPVILVVLFGFAIRTEVKNVKVAVLDESKDELSIEFSSKLFSSSYFVCERVLESSLQIEEAFESGDVDLVLVFPDKFSENFYKGNSTSLQVVVDATNLNNSTIYKNYVNSILEDFSQDKLKSTDPKQMFGMTIRMIYNPEMKDIYMFVPGVLALVLMLISAIMTAVALTKEKETGTFKLLVVSPLSILDIIIGKLVAYLVISIISTLMILILSVWMFQMPVNGSYFDLALVCFLFLTTTLSLGVLISAIAETQQVAVFISLIGLFLPTMLLSGFIYPIENMPYILQIFSNIFPAKWFIIAIKDVMIKGSDLYAICVPMGILLFMNLFLIFVSVKKYRKNFNV